MHVKCRNLATASALYTAAMACGFRESGIGSNNLVGIRISLKLDAPLGYLAPASSFDDSANTNTENSKAKDSGMRVRVLVSPAYLAELALMTHSRFVENFRRRDQLHRKIEKVFFANGDLSKSIRFGGGSDGSDETDSTTTTTEKADKSTRSKEAEKAARREVKRREGLKRQAEKQQQQQAAVLAAAAAAAEAELQVQTEEESGSHPESQPQT